MAKNEIQFSAEEMQALMDRSKGNLGVAELWDGETTNYDFGSAALKKDEKIQQATKLHEDCALSLTKVFKEQTKVSAQFGFEKHELATAKEILNGVDLKKTLVVRWNDVGAGLEGLFLIDHQPFFSFFDYYFGGKSLSVKEENFTELDKAVLIKFLEPISKNLSRAWQPVRRCQFSANEIIQTQEQVVGLGWNFDCFKALFKVNLAGEDQGFLTVVLPKEMLNAIGSDQDLKSDQDANAGRDVFWEKAVGRCLNEMPLLVSTTLATVDLTMGQVLELKVGQTFTLSGSDEDLTTYVDGRAMYLTQAGKVSESRAIKITNPIK